MILLRINLLILIGTLLAREYIEGFAGFFSNLPYQVYLGGLLINLCFVFKPPHYICT